MSGFTEFYISCNPPLLPRGVSSIIAGLSAALQSKFVEVLYEPEAPWLKVIAAAEDQTEVTRWVQSRLEQMLEEETALVDDDFHHDDGSELEGSEPQPDVEIVSDPSHIIPWPLFHNGQAGSLQLYDEYRFPENIKTIAHKQVWRGLETIEGLTIGGLLSKYDFLWPDSDQYPTLDRLAELANCKISHNLQGTVVYIASDSDVRDSVAVIHKLETLLSLLDVPVSKAVHLIFTEGPDPLRVSYRWLTHTGLASLTYIDMSMTDVEEEYQRIAGAASLRVETVDARGRSKPDETVYPVGPNLSKGPKATFSPFACYKYPNKRPGTVAVKENKRPLPSPKDHQKNCPKEVVRPATKHIGVSNTQPSTTKKPEGVKIQVEEIPASNSLNLPVSSCDQFQEPALKKTKAGQSNESPGMLLSGGATQSWQRSCSPIPTRASVAQWIEGIELGSSTEDLDLIPDLTDDKGVRPYEATPNMTASTATLGGGVLLDLEPDTYMPLELNPRRSSNTGSAKQAQIPEFDGFTFPDQTPQPLPSKLETRFTENQCLLDSGSPKKEFHGMFAVVDPFAPYATEDTNRLGEAGNTGRAPSPGANLIDYLEGPIYTPALMDEIPNMKHPASQSTPGPDCSEMGKGDSNIIFGKQADESKEFFQVMRQQAAPRASWADVASKTKNSEKPDVKNIFGQNVRVNVLPDRSKPGGPDKEKVNGVDIRDSQGAKGNKTSTESPKISQPSEWPVSPAKSHGVTTLHSGGTQLVPGMDPASPSFVDCHEVVEQAANELKHLLGVLQVVPGKIRLEAKFGRLCLKNLAPSLVNMGQGPSWSPTKVLETLNTEDLGQEHVGFYPILTTSGSEADMILQMSASRTPWMLVKKQVFYEVVCRARGGTSQYVVKVDAETFTHECLPAAQEMSHVNVHCTQRAWDIRLSMTRMDVDAVPEEFKSFAAALVRSISISTNNMDEIEIVAEEDETLGWEIDRVNVRHLARYRNGTKGRSCLTITMTRAVKRFPDTRGMRKPLYRGHTTPATPPRVGPPTQWFEASISSPRAEELFEENCSLEFGERAGWTPDRLKDDGVMMAICEPALRMVTQMDQVGRSNHNGQGPRTDRRIYDTIAESKDRNKGYAFW